jgi:hypothetical protein
MKKLIIFTMALALVLGSFGTAYADITCPEGEIATNVWITPAVEATEEVSHTEYRWRATIFSSWSSWSTTNNAPGWVHSSNKQTKTVIDQEATSGTEAVYEWQCLVDGEYVPPTPEEPTPVVTEQGGGGIPFQVQDRTELCYGHLGKFLDACMNQWKTSNPELFTNGVMCELAPQSNLYIVDHTIPVPEPKCKEPVLGGSIESQLISKLQQLISLMQQLIALK